MPRKNSAAWKSLNNQIISCARCPRLRAHCEQVAREKRRSFAEWTYWGKPVPNFGDPHTGAGAPLVDDVLKCQLKPLRRGDYAVTFTDSQWARLQAAFPTGVCDWSKDSVGYTANVSWLGFSGGPGGRALGAAPISRPDHNRDEDD
jgi:hypothetical protein